MLARSSLSLCRRFGVHIAAFQSLQDQPWRTVQHPSKALSMGSQATPGSGTDTLLESGVSHRLHDSIFVSADAPVYDVPMSAIHRPLQSSTDEKKVQQFVTDMQRGDEFTPIEVLWVQKGEHDYYFSFGGCHRWEAHKRLNKLSIKAKLVKTTPKSLSVYLGRDPFEGM